MEYQNMLEVSQARSADFKPFIYGLVDPIEPGHVRYVGMAGVRESRPYQHAKWAQKESSKPSHLLHWIRKLQSEERSYKVIKLEELAEGTTRQFLGFVERCYIKSLREIGHKLVNVAEGGLGGAILSPEDNAKRAAKQIGNTYSAGHVTSDATKKQMSESRKRFNEAHPEVVAQIAAQHIGNKHALGHKHTDDAKKRMADAKLGNKNGAGTKHTEETLAQRSEALRRYNADPANREILGQRNIKRAIALKITNDRKKAADALLTPQQKLERQIAKSEKKLAKLRAKGD